MAVHNVLWSGGFDSTYRVCEIIAGTSDTVRPVYLVDSERFSLANELAAMARARFALESRFGCGERLLPIEMYLKDDFPPSPEVKEAFSAVTRRARAGSQYPWLAQFSIDMKHRYASLEICFENATESFGLQDIIFTRREDGALEMSDDAAVRVLFGNYTFPVICLYKPAMEQKAREGGFADILALAWSCHRPVAGKPCGACMPCETSRGQRTGYRTALFGRQRVFISDCARVLARAVESLRGRYF